MNLKSGDLNIFNNNVDEYNDIIFQNKRQSFKVEKN
jgi:hypothetical protein